MIKVRPETNKTMSLVWVTNLSEQYISLLQSSAEHHGLLIVNIVIRSSMNHQVLLVLQLLSSGCHITGLVAGQIVLGCGQTEVSLNNIIIITTQTSTYC